MTSPVAIDRFPAAPMDRSTLFLSAAFVAALIGLAISVTNATTGTTAIVLGVVVPAALAVLAYGFSPDSFVLAGDGRLEVVRRLFGAKSFRIDRVELSPESFGFGGFRLFGSGGAFGWYGLFWRKETGRYRAYVTDRSLLVSCTGPRGLVVISPADTAAFVAAAGAAVSS